VNQLLLFIRSALAGLRQTPFVHSVAVLTLTIALFAGSLARAAHRSTRELLDHLGSEVEVTLYFGETSTDEQLQAARTGVARETGWVAEVVSPTQALERLRKELGDSSGALEGLPENPLPRSIEVHPPPGADPDRLHALASAWERLPGVSAVDYGREWVDRLAAVHRALEIGATAVMALVLLASVVVVAATLQLAVYARRDEIEIQKLVGATDFFVKTPYVIEGALQGILASAFAAGGLFACERLLWPRIASSVGFLVGGLPPMALVAPRNLLELLGTGVLLGVLGSSIAVGRFLRV
jgi:cell division transport system permease protein